MDLTRRPTFVTLNANYPNLEILYIMLRIFKFNKKLTAMLKIIIVTIVMLPLFFVDLKPQPNNKDIYNLNNLCHHKLKNKLLKKLPRKAIIHLTHIYNAIL